MKNNYTATNTDFPSPKKETIDFLLNYSRKLSNLELNGLLSNKSLKSKEN